MLNWPDNKLKIDCSSYILIFFILKANIKHIFYGFEKNVFKITYKC